MKPIGRAVVAALIALVSLETTASGEPAGAIGGLVWLDVNRNGLQDPGEPGVPGVTVTARKDGTGVGTATTGGTGRYLIDKPPSATFTVCFGLSDSIDYRFTRPNAGDDASDSDADPTTGCADAAPRRNLDLDAGLVSPRNLLGDLVWVDHDENGLRDDGEPGVAGVSVILKDDKGKPLRTASTDAAGWYRFGDLPDGTVTVCFTATPGYRFTGPNAGDDTLDSDPVPTSGCTAPVNLGPGNRENLSVDAGLVAVPPGGRASQQRRPDGTLRTVCALLTRRRAVDYCRVDSSLCLASD
jgi:hypothetical protein